MGTADSNPLVRLYAGRIGAPSTGDEAYGYWLFVLGLVTAFVGIAVVLPTETGDTLRGVGIAVAAIGLVLLLIGPIVRLPLRRVATFVSYLGSLVALLAVVWFGRDFGQGNWSSDFGNNEPFVIALYGLGIAIIAVGAVITPMLTGPRQHQETPQQTDESQAESDPDEDESQKQDENDRKQADNRDARVRRILLRAELQRIQDSQSQFELYTDRADQHRWRLRHRNRNIIATSGEGYASRQKAQQGVSAVKRDALGAALVDLDRTDVDIATVGEAIEGEAAPEFVAEAESRATFESYADAAERFRWRLRHDNGDIIADSSQGYSTEQSRDKAIEYVRHYAATADYLRIDPAAFEVVRGASGTYRWRLLARNGEVLAESGESYSSRRKARQGIDSVQQSVREDGTGEFEVAGNERGTFRWRLLHDSNSIATSGEAYTSEEGAEAAIERVREFAPDAHVLDIGSATFEIYEDAGGEWRWRLRHRNGSILADSGEGYGSRSAVEDGIRSVKRNASNAEVRAVNPSQVPE